MKSYKFCENVSIAKGLEIEGESESCWKKNSDGKEITENINDRSVTKFVSVEDPSSTCTELLQMRQLLFLKFQI